MVRMEHAGFWIRFAAYLVDSIIVNMISALIAIVIIVLAYVIGNQIEMALIIGLVIFYIGFFLVDIVYYSIMENSAKQATFGKQLLKLKVIDRDAKRISYLRALGRWCIKMVGSVLISGLIFIVIGLSKNKQGVHDMLLKTLVVKK